MSKQKIRQLALDNGFKLKEQPNGDMDLNPYVYHFAAALIKDQSGWVSVDEYSESLTDGQLCWVLFPDNSVKLCRLNEYRKFGAPVDFWQDMGGNDLFMNATKFIKINQPLPPTEEA